MTQQTSIRGAPPVAASPVGNRGRLIAWLARADQLLRVAEQSLIAALLAIAALVVVVDICARFLFGASLGAAPEFVRYSIIWMVFIGGSVAARRGVHISIDALQGILPESAGRYLTAAITGLCSLFCLFLLYHSWIFTRTIAGFGQRTSAMDIPMWWVMMAIPLGCGLMALRFAERAVRIWFSRTQGAQRAPTDLAG